MSSNSLLLRRLANALGIAIGALILTYGLIRLGWMRHGASPWDLGFVDIALLLHPRHVAWRSHIENVLTAVFGAGLVGGCVQDLMRTSRVLVLRALAAVLTLPFMATIVGPAVVLLLSEASLAGGVGWLGLVPLLGGLALLCSCVVRFAVDGQGTLAPWDPPRSLVGGGPYQHVRNPMYLGVVAILAGEAALFGSASMAIYAGITAVLFHVRVVRVEEPRLRAAHADAYEDYRRRVPRWIPRK